jgi:hypothetical protein
VPFPVLLLFGFGLGAGAALAGAAELRVSPRSVLLTDGFGAFAAFMVLLLVPTSVYFYIFHGDWFLLYTVDVRRVPSAIALIGFAAELGIGLLGFGLSASCIRSARPAWSIALIGMSMFAAAGVVFLFPERLKLVGSIRQYRGGFGLVNYGGPLMQSAIVMGILLVWGAIYLVVRVRRG